MLKTPARAQEAGSPLSLRGLEHGATIPSHATAPSPCSESASLPPRMPQGTRPAPCSSTAPKNRAGDSAQPTLTHTALMMTPHGPCPLWPTSASHLQQQTRGQLRLFPLQHPTLSLPAQLETRAHEHNQEKQFSFRAAKLSRARSSGLGWPLPAMADTRPSPLSYLSPYLLFHPGWSPSP